MAHATRAGRGERDVHDTARAVETVEAEEGCDDGDRSDEAPLDRRQGRAEGG